MPKCASDAITIEGGRDLLLQSIEVEDEQKVDSISGQWMLVECVHL